MMVNLLISSLGVVYSTLGIKNECQQLGLTFSQPKLKSSYLSNTVPLVVVGVAMSPSEVPLPWLRLGLQTLLTEADEKSSGGSSGQPNCSLVFP